MLRSILCLSLVLLTCVAASGQQVGQSRDDVRRARGEPMMEKKSADGETWIYADGTKFVFRNGVAADAPKATNLSLDREGDDADNVTIVAGPARVEAVENTSSNSNGDISSSRRLGASPMLILYALIGVCVIAKIWFLVVTFQQGIGWGLGCIFVPFVSLFFLFKFWHEAKAPFLTLLLAAIATGAAAGAMVP